MNVKSVVDVYVGLGANLGDRAENLRRALEELHALSETELVATSRFYETKAAFVEDQPDFLNACAQLKTALDPQTLLSKMLAIEESMGRVRNIPKGPRTIDLDILFYGDRIIDEEGLTVPHPDLHNREFVLAPLKELAADVIHPRLGRRVGEL